MTNAKYAWIVVGVIVVLGLGYMFTRGGKSAEQGKATNSSVETSASESAQSNSASTGAFSGSFTDLARRGGNYACTITPTAGESAQISGVVYITGARMRGDFSMVVAQAKMNVQTHMINDGGYAYVWSSLTSAGTKMKTTQPTATDAKTANYSIQGVDINKQFIYDCKSWIVDTSVFVPPANVTFTEAK